jgi:hypothetical protein
MANLSVTDSTGTAQLIDLNGLGTAASPFVAKSPELLGALNATPAATPTDANVSISAILRGLWQAVISQGTPPTMTDYNTMGTSAGAVIKNSAGNLHVIACTNLNAATRYLQLFNNATGPTGTPLKSYPVYGNGGFIALDTAYFGISAKGRGLVFSTGISWGISTTPLAYTAATASETIVEARYV